MSGAGVQRAKPNTAVERSGRSPMAHLLHALNQPLTGLQCALELATAGPKRNDQYVETLRESLDLTGRMRALVDAIRELSDLQQSIRQNAEMVLLDRIFRETASELAPVAQGKRVEMKIDIREPLRLQGDRSLLTSLSFRLLDSALALSREEALLELCGWRERQSVAMQVAWRPGPAPEHSPFSPAELGCLIAQAGWEQAGAEWTRSQGREIESCTLRMPAASSFHQEQGVDLES